jgi:hypothetical protein
LAPLTRLTDLNLRRNRLTSLELADLASSQPQQQQAQALPPRLVRLSLARNQLTGTHQLLPLRQLTCLSELVSPAANAAPDHGRGAQHHHHTRRLHWASAQCVGRAPRGSAPKDMGCLIPSVTALHGFLHAALQDVSSNLFSDVHDVVGSSCRAAVLCYCPASLCELNHEEVSAHAAAARRRASCTCPASCSSRFRRFKPMQLLWAQGS